MNNKKVRIIVWTILVFVWMTTVYYLSSKDGTESSGQSGVIVQSIMKLNPNLENMELEQRQQIEDKVEKVVRKSAHFALYALGGILIVILTTECEAQNPKFAAWLIGTLYATTDEWHQYYVPGRSAEIKDVCLDAVGILAGVVIVWVVIKMVQKRKNKKLQENVYEGY